MGCSASNGGDITQQLVTIDETNATAAIKITGRSFVNPANDIFGGIVTTRWNRSRMVRVSNFSPDTIYFWAQGIPGGDGNLAVLVNGVLFQALHITNSDAVPRMYSVSGMGSAPKTIDFIEDFQEHLGALNTGLDAAVGGTYVLRVLISGGATITTAKASNGIVAIGDSHVDGLATVPCSYYGWAGQLRRAAHAQGWLFGYAGAGSSTMCADGLTAADTAQEVHDLWANMGTTNKRFLMMRRPNDYAYYGINTSTTPAQYQTYLQSFQTALDSSDPGWTGIYAQIIQGTNWGANGGGFTRDGSGDAAHDYWTATVAASTASGRTNVQTFPLATFGLTLNDPLGWFEANPGEVHMLQKNHDKVFAKARTWYGL